MFFQFGDFITALITLATNCSPNWMSCGFSSDWISNCGSTKLTAGSLPRFASV